MKEEANSPEAFGGSFQRRKEVEGDKNMALSNSNDRWELLESGLIDKNMALKNSNDHWAFLDHLLHNFRLLSLSQEPKTLKNTINVDLTLEAISTDGDCFYRSHL
ncbi:hypothetical protein ACFX2J_007454 [Malus domestica]